MVPSHFGDFSKFSIFWPQNGPKWAQFRAPQGFKNGSKMVKTGLNWLKTTQNMLKTCFYDVLEKFDFFDFLTQNGPKMAKSQNAQFLPKSHFWGPKTSIFSKTTNFQETRPIPLKPGSNGRFFMSVDVFDDSPPILRFFEIFDFLTQNGPKWRSRGWYRPKWA